MSAPSPAEIQKCFDKIDVDGGGTLSLEEVAQAMEQMGMNIAPADLARSFARVDDDNEGELDLEEFTHLVSSLEHGPVPPTPTDRRSEAALALRKRRHRHATSSRRLDTTSFRHRWTSAEDAKSAPGRTADRAVHRASWARQPEDWGGLSAGFEDTLVEPWDESLSLPEWKRDIKPPAWLRRATRRLSGAEERRAKAKTRLRAISSQAVTLQRESEYDVVQDPAVAHPEIKQDHDRLHMEENDGGLADPSLSRLRRNHAEQLRRVDTAQSVEHFLYYLPADQATRFGHLHEQLVESRPSTAGDPRAKPAQRPALAAASTRSGSRSGSRSGLHSRGSSVGGRAATPLSFTRLRDTARDDARGMPADDAGDLDKWGGWADDIHAIREQEMRRAKLVAAKEEAAATARKQAAQHEAVMRELRVAVEALGEAELTIERYRKALGKRIGWQELLESLRQGGLPEPEPEPEPESELQPEPEPELQPEPEPSEEDPSASDAAEENLVEQAARRARLVRRKKLDARAHVASLKLSEEEVTARAKVAHAALRESKVALAFAQREIDLERRRAARAAAGIGAPAARASGAARGSGAKRRSMQAVQRLRIVERDAAAALALEEYSLLALEDEEENLRQLLHEVDATLPLTTRRSGLSQAKPLPKPARPGSPSAAASANGNAARRQKSSTGAEDTTLLSKAEIAANQLEALVLRVSQCRNAAMRSLAARLRQTEEELALRKEQEQKQKQEEEQQEQQQKQQQGKGRRAPSGQVQTAVV
jgi:hypothetical protein